MTIVVGLVPCCNKVLGEPNDEQETVLSMIVEFGDLTYCCDLTGSNLFSCDEAVSVPVYGKAPSVLEAPPQMAVVEAESKASGGLESPLVQRLVLG